MPRQGRCPELAEGKEVPEALGNRNGECAIAISPSRTGSKIHLAPHFPRENPWPRVDGGRKKAFIKSSAS